MLAMIRVSSPGGRTGGAVEVPEIQCVGVIGFPRREEHGQARHKRRKDAFGG